MTKADVVKEIAEKTGIEKRDVLSTVEAFMDVVKESLSNHEPVYLRGFGSFIIKKRAEKTARNIRKDETLKIPAHDIPAFKPAKTFRKIIPSIKATRYFISRSKPLSSNDDREITLFYSAIRVYNLIFTLLIYGFHRIIRRVG